MVYEPLIAAWMSSPCTWYLILLVVFVRLKKSPNFGHPRNLHYQLAWCSTALLFIPDKNIGPEVGKHVLGNTVFTIT